jgi:hypothetical protein
LQAAGRRRADLALPARGAGVVETTVADLWGIGCGVVFGLQVLTSRDEDQGFLDRLVFRAVSAGLQSVDQKGRVGQIGPLVLAVPGASVVVVGDVDIFRFVPLQALEPGIRPTNHGVVTSVRVGGAEAEFRRNERILQTCSG